MRIFLEPWMLKGCLATIFWSLNFRHSSLIIHNSSLITHHSKYQGCLASSLTSHHLIFFTLFVDPTPFTWSKHFYFVTRGIPFHPYQPSLFSFPLSPSSRHSPKAQTRTLKISQPPSPRQDRHQWTTPISPTCTAARSPPSRPSDADEHKETSSISPFCHRRSPPTQDSATSSLFVLFHLVYLSDLWFAFGFWEKWMVLAWTLFAFVFPRCGWWENNKGTYFFGFFFFFFFLFIWYYCVCFNGLKYANGFYSK